MRLFDCPLLDGVIELTDEREEHIESGHPELLPRHLAELAQTLAEPDDVILGLEQEKRFFLRWTDTILGGRFIIAIVVSDPARIDRHWLVTAFLAKRRPVNLQ